MSRIGELEIELPDIENGTDRPVEFSLMFGEFLITATARNTKTNQVYSTKFAYVRDNPYFEASDR